MPTPRRSRRRQCDPLHERRS